MSSKNLFIAGTPGVGKTTLIKEVTLPYRDRIGGFFTEEIREGRNRLGFVLKTFDGREGLLAEKGRKTPHKVGKYGVEVSTLDAVGTPALELAIQEKDLIVIDEIGVMEMFSERFHAVLMQCLTSPKRVLATIRAGAKPFTEEIQRLANTATWRLTRANYPEIKQNVRQWLDEF
ncbi:MAG: AAA family ATPase [Elusimicrobia bacterium]|nr:AAA family ATPase [Elusimicrobiota bacterium]